MKSTALGVIAGAASLVLTSCTAPCPQCRTLPAAGTYEICEAEGPGAEHLKTGDKVLIGRIGNVTHVAFGPADDPTKTRVQAFEGSRGLVGWLPRDSGHDNHVVVISSVNLSKPSGQCKAGNVISVEFEKPDNEGKYTGARSGPHYGHIHGQIESLVVPSL
jgi:hypothetical protein